AGVIVEPGEEAAGLVEDELPPVRGDPLGREVRLVDAHVAVLADVDAEDDVARGGRATRATARCREGDGDGRRSRENPSSHRLDRHRSPCSMPTAVVRRW